MFAGFATICTLGCAIPTRVAELDLQIPKGATPVAIQAGLDKMDDPNSSTFTSAQCRTATVGHS